jgi:hypothetical protein
VCAAYAGAAWSWRLRHTFADRPWLRLCSCEDRSSNRRPFLCPHISGAVRRWCRRVPDSRRWEVHVSCGRCGTTRQITVTPRSQWLRKTFASISFGVILRHVLKPWMKPRSRKVEALCGNARNDEGAHGRLHGPSACHVPRHVSEVTLGSARPASSLLPRRPRQCTRTNVG